MNQLPSVPDPSSAIGRRSKRVERLRWQQASRRGAAAPRRPIRLWFPLTALLIVFSPLLLLVLAVAVFLPRPIGVNPIHLMLGVGRMLMALSGTEVEVENDHRPVTIKII